jgi:mRNA-degrading endonuclease RelE of RelBE toxin-antitoxin system
MKTIVFTDKATKLFDALPADVQAAIEKALAKYAIDRTGDVKKLHGVKDIYRMRVGRYRVFLTEDHGVIHVLYAGKRETTTYN